LNLQYEYHYQEGKEVIGMDTFILESVMLLAVTLTSYENVPSKVKKNIYIRPGMGAYSLHSILIIF